MNLETFKDGTDKYIIYVNSLMSDKNFDTNFEILKKMISDNLDGNFENELLRLFAGAELLLSRIISIYDYLKELKINIDPFRDSIDDENLNILQGLVYNKFTDLLKKNKVHYAKNLIEDFGKEINKIYYLDDFNWNGKFVVGLREIRNSLKKANRTREILECLEIELYIMEEIVDTDSIDWFKEVIKEYNDLKSNLEKDEAVIEAKVQERNEIIAKLSHSIKNLIRSAVIDPLSYLQQSDNLNQKTIQDALKGANLIREIVNGINLSFKGSFEDFIYDAKHTSFEPFSFNDIFLDSFKYAVSNMLDGKYFNVFLREYFKSKETYLQASSEWTQVSNSKNFDDFINYTSKYFIDINIDLNDISVLVTGNEKGSAIKFLIMIQEMLFNAVKYSAFVPREKRKIEIKATRKNNKIVIVLINSFNDDIHVKTSGLGSIIIENFSKILRGELNIEKNDGLFKLQLEFDDLWV